MSSVIPCLRKDTVKTCDPSKLHANEMVKKVTIVALSLLLISGGVAICMNMQVFPTQASALLTGAVIVSGGLILSATLLSYCRPSKETMIKTSLFVLSILMISGGVAIGMSQVFPTSAACILAGGILGTGGLILQGALLESCRRPPQSKVRKIPLPQVQKLLKTGYYTGCVGSYFFTCLGGGTDTIYNLGQFFESKFNGKNFDDVIQFLNQQTPNVMAMVSVHARGEDKVWVASIGLGKLVVRGSNKVMGIHLEPSSRPGSKFDIDTSLFNGIVLSYGDNIMGFDPDYNPEASRRSVSAYTDSLSFSRSSIRDSFYITPITQRSSLCIIEHTPVKKSFKLNEVQLTYLEEVSISIQPYEITPLLQNAQLIYMGSQSNSVGKALLRKLQIGNSLVEAAEALTQKYPDALELVIVRNATTGEGEYVVIGQGGVDTFEAVLQHEEGSLSTATLPSNTVILSDDFDPVDLTNQTKGASSTFVSNQPYFLKDGRIFTCIGPKAQQIGEECIRRLQSGDQFDSLKTYLEGIGETQTMVFLHENGLVHMFGVGMKADTVQGFRLSPNGQHRTGRFEGSVALLDPTNEPIILPEGCELTLSELVSPIRSGTVTPRTGTKETRTPKKKRPRIAY